MQDFLPADGSVSLTLIDTCLRIFEAVTGATDEAIVILSNQLDTLGSALANTLLSSFLLAVNPPAPQLAQRAIDCLLSTLKLLIDLTTRTSDWSAALGRNSVLVGTLLRLVVATRRKEATAGEGLFVLQAEDGAVREGGAESGVDGTGRRDHTLDVLCLVLGVLANLIETEVRVRRIVRETSKLKKFSQCHAQLHSHAPL